MSSICNDLLLIFNIKVNINIFANSSGMNTDECGIYYSKMYIFWKIRRDIFSIFNYFLDVFLSTLSFSISKMIVADFYINQF